VECGWVSEENIGPEGGAMPAGCMKKAKLHGMSPQANYTERPPLVGEVSANFWG
jgi:hypothetical protein